MESVRTKNNDFTIWKNKSGEMINIKDMTNKYIKRCIGLLKSSGNPTRRWIRKNWIKSFENELKNRI